MSLHSKLDGGSVRPSSSWIHRAIDDVKCLTVMLQPLSIFAVMSVMGLVAAKLILNFSVVDETGMPFADDTKAFGLLTYLTMGICIVSIYFKETFWINPHVDYILVAIPFIILGPLIWCLTRITFLNASYKFLIISIMPNFVFGPILFLDKSMTFAKFIRHALRQLVELFVFILVSIFNLAVSLTFLTLSRTENHGKAVSVVEMVKAVCLFGIVFPILRFFSMQGARRGLKAHEAKEPTNVLEEMEMKNILFRFIACQEMLWNTLSRLLLAEIRDNTTFGISVLCSHLVIFVTRVVSAAAFRRLQMERKGKTAPILTEAYDQIQRQVTKTRRVGASSVEGGLPGYDRTTEFMTIPGEPTLFPPVSRKETAISRKESTIIRKESATSRKERVAVHLSSSGDKEEGTTAVTISVSSNSPPSNFTPSSDSPMTRKEEEEAVVDVYSIDFTPMSDETRYAFSNLASMFAEWCGRISAFLITLLFTATPPQYTWTQCRDPLTVRTHLIRGVAMILLSLFIDASGLMVEYKVSETGIREAVEEFRTAKVSWLVYLEMSIFSVVICGTFLMAMPGILEDGNECFRAGRKVWM